MANKIDPEIVRELLQYEPETGKLFWERRIAGPFITHSYAKRFNSIWAGKEAFTAPCGNGYLQGSIFSKKQLAHRVIWAIIQGKWPLHEIDHINGDRSDNRIENLREVDRSENCRNLSLRSDNKTGHIGVQWAKGAYQAGITISGTRINLGRFKCLEDAVSARKAAQEDCGFHPNHGRAA